jgi:thiamine biosynthesis lipoprotein
MKIDLLAPILAGAILLSGCSGQETSHKPQRYQASFLNLFDTVTTIVGYAPSKDAFTDTVQALHDQLLEYHQLFDIYNDYPGLNNLKTINDCAGSTPVKVDGRIVELLQFCREVYDRTGGTVNAGMGGVLALWHQARTKGLQNPELAILPDPVDLQQAALHTNLDNLVIDEDTSSVFIKDPLMQLDVGAIAKGYAVEQVCRSAPEGMLISVGGNVCATGPKPGRTPWTVGIQDPDGGEGAYLHTLSVSSGCVVTSGDYQRTYWVDDTAYHHIIDPESLMPGRLWRCVTVLCPQSGLGDALSTALFLLSQAEGQALLDLFGAEAMWVDREGREWFSPGFSKHIKL